MIFGYRIKLIRYYSVMFGMLLTVIFTSVNAGDFEGRIGQFGFISLSQREGLSDEEITYLARTYSIITLNKLDGANEEGSIMSVISAMAEKLKDVNPNLKVLCYLNSVIAIPGSPPTKEFLEHPEWALKDTNGDAVLIRGLKNYDMRIPEVRDYWAESCNEMVSYPGIDGVFVDAIPKFGMKNHPDTWSSLSHSGSKALSLGAYELLRITKERMESDKLLIFNGIRGDTVGWADGGMQFLDHSSGCLVEHFCAFSSREAETGKLNKEKVAKDIELIGKASDMGKTVLVKGWPGKWSWLSDGYKDMSQSDKREIASNHLEFSLATFLIAGGKNCFFEYSFGYRRDGGIFEHYDLLDKEFGQPLGRASRKGFVFSREYEHCSVWVDLGKEKAKITWKH